MPKIELSNKEILFYKKIGSGSKILIMVHGNISSGLHFKPIEPYLMTDYTIYIPDLRGFGNSSYFTPVNKIKDLSDDLNDFVKKLNLDTFALLGWSAGGCVCMQYSADYPDKIKALILINSVGYKGCPMLDENHKPYVDKESMKCEPTQIKPVLEALENEDKYFIKQLWNNAIFIKQKPSLEEYEQYALASLKQRNLLDIYWSLSVFNISNEHNSYSKGTNEISNIKVPVLLTWGEYDKIVTEQEVRETADILSPNSKIIILKDSGHCPFLDSPKILIEEIQKFLDRS